MFTSFCLDSPELIRTAAFCYEIEVSLDPPYFFNIYDLVLLPFKFHLQGSIS